MPCIKGTALEELRPLVLPEYGAKSRNRRREVAPQPSSLFEWLTPVERPRVNATRIVFVQKNAITGAACWILGLSITGETTAN
jgi:hypothetical protein